MTAEVVGPVPTIRFHDGTRQAYETPRNTMDNRFAACTDHHPACDCREAELHEHIDELAGELRELRKVAERVLKDHPAMTFYRDSLTGEELQAHCMCTGCQIIRAVHSTAAYTVADERDASAESWARREWASGPEHATVGRRDVLRDRLGAELNGGGS